jgi:lipopolysaccharide transport system ATP-binding protein
MAIIEIKNIGKKYNISHQKGGYVALRDVIANIAKSPFKFLTRKAKNIIGITNQEDFWALKNINFEVEKGDVVGIIGNNGAGKSTLLKILSQITPPTEGKIIIRGNIGSLLEVGTGFHPELTGRENIFLNGAILGMTRSEIVKKFDQIVEFAGIKKFLDTPVKRYSSGMYVRLAFSVAAHLEPDILIIDEVLAVGDVEFQKKCLGKMGEITQQEGKTILFVSHNMAAIKKLCNKCVLLKNGKVDLIGDTDMVISKYLEILSNSIVNDPIADRKRISKATLRAKLIDINLTKHDSHSPEIITNGREPLTLTMTIEAYNDNIETSVQLYISDNFQVISYLDSAFMHNQVFKLKKGINKIKCNISKLNLFDGDYKIACNLTIPYLEVIDFVPDAYHFSVKNFDPYHNGAKLHKSENFGFFHIDHQWMIDDVL